MGKVYLVTLLLVVFTNLELVFSDESCQLKDRPRLQIVFVVSYSLDRDSPRGWMRYQRETITAIMDQLQRDSMDVEYSVAGFVDYDDEANPKERLITDQELCYFVTQEFTTDHNKTLEALLNTKGSTASNGIGDQDSVTTAMLMAAVDRRLRWNAGFYDANGKTVRKIMIPMTFRKNTKSLKAPGSRTPAKADGTDKCALTLPPKMKELNQVLFNNNIAVFNSILNFRYKDEWLTDYYHKEFASLLVPYYQFPIPEAKKEATEYGPFNFKTYAQSLVQKIKQEVMTCDWEEPKGYNSLGL